VNFSHFVRLLFVVQVFILGPGYKQGRHISFWSRWQKHYCHCYSQCRAANRNGHWWVSMCLSLSFLLLNYHFRCFCTVDWAAGRASGV